jgi:hypothetical protein
MHIQPFLGGKEAVASLLDVLLVKPSFRVVLASQSTYCFSMYLDELGGMVSEHLEHLATQAL